MDQLFDFVTNHPFLVGSFVILLILFVRNEMRRGGPSVSAQQLVDQVNRQQAVVLDIRDKKEFDQGHIVDAINVPYTSLESHLSELKKYKEQPIIVACRMGQHAGAAGTLLRKNGFTSVSRLAGGIVEWRNQKLPVVKGKK